MTKPDLEPITPDGPFCDPETGVCAAPPLETSRPAPARDSAGWDLVYIGDPMCSWCWGVEPVVRRLPEFCAERGAGFSIVAGGLAPGGGFTWDERFKTFLRNEWRHIQTATGQPFSVDLLERDHFHYDTEPPCRAVVLARSILAGRDENDRLLAAFFAALQRRFYVDNQDPATLEFYREPAAQIGLDFEAFAARFDGDDARQAVRREFELNRSWWVRGFPSFALRRGDAVEILASGYVDLPKLTTLIGASQLLKT